MPRPKGFKHAPATIEKIRKSLALVQQLQGGHVYGALLPETVERFKSRWPNATEEQFRSFAEVFQAWRQLKAELVDAHRGFSPEMIAAVEPCLTSGSRSSLDPLVIGRLHRE